MLWAKATLAARYSSRYSPAMNPPVITLRNVTKRYGALTALDKVTVEIPSGRVGLLGPNGAGKTTMLKVLLGLLTPQGGTIDVLGQSVRPGARKLRSLVGYMPENEVYLPGMSAVDMAAYAGQLCGLPKNEALRRGHEALNFVGLGDKRYQTVDSYSTGQKQRAKLACALVHDPKLLLLDEPTNGLDPEGRDAMLDLIASLPERRNLSFLLSTHLLKDVERICDHVVFVDQGKIVRSEALEQVRKVEAAVWQVRTKAGQRESLLEALSEAGIEAAALGTRYVLAKLQEGTGPKVILQTALQSNLQVRHLTPYRRSLEDAFLSEMNGRLTATSSLTQNVSQQAQEKQP